MTLCDCFQVPSQSPVGNPNSLSDARSAQSGLNKQRDTWPRINVGDIGLLVLRYLHDRGHIVVAKKDVDYFVEASATLGEMGARAVPLMLVTIQTLACTPSAKEYLLFWAKRERMTGVPDLCDKAIKNRNIRPSNMAPLWTFEMFSLASLISSKFLNQGAPEDTFARSKSLGDVFDMVGNECPDVDIIIIILYLVRASPWCWPTVFRETGTIC